MIIYDKKKDTDRNIDATMIEMIGKKKELGSYERLSITKVSIDPFHTDKKHFHKCSDELYYVVKGSCTLEIDDQHYWLEEGMCILVEHGEHHFVRSLDHSAEFLVICSPAWDENDVFYV